MLPRHELPQIPTKEVPRFVHFCQENGVPVRAVHIHVMKLLPIQKHLNVDKVKRFLDIKDSYQVPLIISNDNHIVDGHHRWASAAVNDRNAKILCLQFGCDVKELVDLGHQFDGSVVKSVAEVIKQR